MLDFERYPTVKAIWVYWVPKCLRLGDPLTWLVVLEPAVHENPHLNLQVQPQLVTAQ